MISEKMSGWRETLPSLAENVPSTETNRYR